MNSSPSDYRSDLVRALTALRSGDAAAAGRAIEKSALPASVIASAADVAMRDRRWAEAAWLFDRLPQRDPTSCIKLCMSRNLAALQTHRRSLHDLLITLPTSNHCGIGASSTGHPTIVSRSADGRNIALSPENKPLLGLSQAWAHLKPAFDGGHSVGLCGIGDGYLLHELAHKPPRLFMDTQQCIFVIEPDPHVLMTAIMIHDYAGASGPIEQERFRWFVGKSWTSDMRDTLEAETCLPYPHMSLMLGLTARQIQAEIESIIRASAARDASRRQEVEAYYAGLKPSEIGSLFVGQLVAHPTIEPVGSVANSFPSPGTPGEGQGEGSSQASEDQSPHPSPLPEYRERVEETQSERPARRPRVLLLTTRFSTVLQYSTHDAASAFIDNGWEAHVLIEPSPHHRLLTTAMRSALAEFKPDLVFQIDHHRQSHGDLFPPNLPFACWIQDHLPHLTRREVGEKIGPTDFVLTDSAPTYVHSHGYPAEQMIALSKLTPPPDYIAEPTREAEDMIFVSNASASPLALRDALVARAGEFGVEPGILGDCLDRMIAMFGVSGPRGECNHDIASTFGLGRRGSGSLAPVLGGEDQGEGRNVEYAGDCQCPSPLGPSPQPSPPRTGEREQETSLVTSTTESQGAALSTASDIIDFIRQHWTDAGQTPPAASLLALARAILHPFCDALYRQEALGWAIDAGRELGLSLGLYGKGWAQNPRFAAYARGPIGAGQDLHELTRAAKINLQIVPYLCLHQRLLDGVGAGAFFLIRQHVGDVAPQQMLDLVDEVCGTDVRTLADAASRVPPPHRQRFEQLLKECRRACTWSAEEDPIETIRCWQEAGLLDAGRGVLPRLAEVSFTDAPSLQERLKRFITQADVRRAIVLEQRSAIESRLTYRSALRRVAGRIGEILQRGAPQSFVGVPINIDLGFAA